MISNTSGEPQQHVRSCLASVPPPPNHLQPLSPQHDAHLYTPSRGLHHPPRTQTNPHRCKWHATSAHSAAFGLDFPHHPTILNHYPHDTTPTHTHHSAAYTTPQGPNRTDADANGMLQVHVQLHLVLNPPTSQPSLTTVPTTQHPPVHPISQPTPLPKGPNTMQ